MNVCRDMNTNIFILTLQVVELRFHNLPSDWPHNTSATGQTFPEQDQADILFSYISQIFLPILKEVVYSCASIITCKSSIKDCMIKQLFLTLNSNKNFGIFSKTSFADLIKSATQQNMLKHEVKSDRISAILDKKVLEPVIYQQLLDQITMIEKAIQLSNLVEIRKSWKSLF